MAAAGMGVRGGDQLVSTLHAAARELSGLVDAHAEAGQLLADRGAATAPRRTGHLAASHEAIVNAGAVEVTNTATYAGYVHALDPWLTRELTDLHDQLIDIYAAGVAGVVATIRGA